MKIDNDYHPTHQRRGCIFVFITALARMAGLTTFISLGFLTYLEWLTLDSINFEIYVTIVTIIVGYLELLWILDKCVTCCFCCFRGETCLYWVCCIPIDNWVKSIVYIGLSIPFFIPTWLLASIRTDVIVIGSLLIITGLLYFIKTFKYKRMNPDDFQEDDNLSRPSISTQTSSTGINNDNLPSAFTVNQEMNHIQ